MGEIKHRKVSDIPENTTDAPGVVGPTDWNDDHDISLALADLSGVDPNVDIDTGAGEQLTWDGTKWTAVLGGSRMFAFMGW